ncbi:MAG TPA: cation diffusion facilitator family transporter [Acidimicrobiales bacterium]|nr:cation diffusion facilitator family transporter [Acidimicrobiales bacterium]
MSGHDHGADDHGRDHDHAGDHDHPHAQPAGHTHDHGDHDHDHAGGLRGAVRAVFAPHSHDAADSVDQALEDSREGMRALKISLLGLAVTAALQVVVVLISGSVALLADTVHNFADALTAVPLAIAFWIGRRPPNRRYTYGYGRAEDLAGIFIVAMIALSAAVAGWEAVHRLLDPREVRNVGWVIAAGLIGFVGNELVAVYRIRVGRKIGSAALVADGLHARTDGVTSLGVVVGGVGVAAGWELADPIVGLVITVAILVVLKSAARDIYRRLMDSVDPELVDAVEAVLAGVPGIQAVERVRIRWVGHELRAEAEVVSDSRLTVAESHRIAEEAHHLLLHRIPKLARAIIHTNPCDHDGLDHHLITEHHFARP